MSNSTKQYSIYCAVEFFGCESTIWNATFQSRTMSIITISILSKCYEIQCNYARLALSLSFFLSIALKCIEMETFLFLAFDNKACQQTRNRNSDNSPIVVIDFSYFIIFNKQHKYDTYVQHNA